MPEKGALFTSPGATAMADRVAEVPITTAPEYSELEVVGVVPSRV